MVLSRDPNEAELQKLRSEQVPESTTLDYKTKLSIGTDEEKKEFLADVVSFANTSGGHLVIGMQEEKGFPTELPGIRIDDPDQKKLQLEDIIREGIAQRIAGILIRVIPLANGNHAIVIHIPRSLAAPHMVSFKRSSRFYARNSAGKYQLDIQELRRSFLLSESTEHRIRDFRLDRVAKIGAYDTPVRLFDQPKIILHSVPISAYQAVPSFSISEIPRAFMDYSQYSSRTHRFNLDGVVFYSPLLQLDHLSASYEQVFRNGNYEFVDASVISTELSRSGGKLDLPSPEFDNLVIRQTYSASSFQKSLGIEPPIYVFLTLTGVRGIRMGTIHTGLSSFHEQGIDRDVLLIPDLMFETYPADLDQVARLLRPAFDAVWNAAGWPYSIHYGQDGSWQPKR